MYTGPAGRSSIYTPKKFFASLRYF